MRTLSRLPGSHSSTLELVELDGKKYVLKTAEAEDIW